MSPSEYQDQTERHSSPGSVRLPPWPTLASDETYGRYFAHIRECPFVLVIDDFACGVWTTSFGERTPTVNVALTPGGPLDFADPVEGFDASHPQGAQLIAWADDLVTVEVPGRWAFVVDAVEPMDAEWFAWLEGARRARLTVFFQSLQGGLVDSAFIDAQPSLWASIEDRRHLNHAG
jgi:hypothetical protein